jgi:hypothetical protein
MNRFTPIIVLAVLIMAAVPAIAAPLTVTSYDLPNGHGVASGGTFNYWDRNYSGAGSTTTDNAPLTGGLGDLTDGVIATDNWFNVEVAAGTGPYVGWGLSVNPLPTVTFRFGTAVSLSSLTLHVDDTDGAGGVDVPASVDIGVEGGPYTNFAITDLPGASPEAYTLSGLGLAGSAFDVRFHYKNEWVFVSEVTFDGTATSVPEPSAAVMVGIGLLGIAARSRRRRSSN